jgi:hypothetical protein
MKLLQEITKWDCGVAIPNHTYMINDAGKCVGYIKAGTTDEIMFSKPMSFSKSYRKFNEVK